MVTYRESAAPTEDGGLLRENDIISFAHAIWKVTFLNVTAIDPTLAVTLISEVELGDGVKDSEVTLRIQPARSVAVSSKDDERMYGALGKVFALFRRAMGAQLYSFSAEHLYASQRTWSQRRAHCTPEHKKENWVTRSSGIELQFKGNVKRITVKNDGEAIGGIEVVFNGRWF